jgi:O-antigen ligase
MQQLLTRFIFILIAFGALVAPFSTVILMDQVNYFSLVVAPEQFKTFYFSVLIFPMLIVWTLGQGFSSPFLVVKTKFYIPIIMFLAYSAYSLSYAVNVEAGLNLTLQYGIMALIFFLVLNLVKRIDDVIYLINLFILVAVLASVIALVQYYFADSQVVSGFIRQAVAPASTFGNKNMLVHFLVLTLPISIGLAVFSNQRYQIVLYTLASVIMAWILVHTYTRAGWLAAMLQLSLLLVFLWIEYYQHQSNPFKQNQKIHTQKIIILLSGIMLWFLLINYTDQGWQWNMVNIAERINMESGGRIAAWVNSLEMIKDNPWFGVGAGSWQYEYAHYYDRIMPDVVYNENVRLERLHNDFLEMIANFGLVGFSILLLLAGMLIQTVLTLLRHVKEQVRRLSVLLTLALLGFGISAMFSFPLRVLFPGIIVMIYLALIVHFSLGTSIKHYRLSFGFGKLLTLPLIMLALMLSWNGFNRLMSSHYDGLSVRLSAVNAGSESFFASLRALSYMPDNYQTLFSLARTSFKLGKVKQSIKMLEHVHQLNPRFDQPLLALALAYSEQNEVEKAIDTLKKLIELDPKKVKAHAMMTRLYLKKNDIKNAQKHYYLMLKWQLYFKGRAGFSNNKQVVSKTIEIYSKNRR